MPEKLFKKLEHLKAKKELYKTEIKENKKIIHDNNKNIKLHEQAKEVVRVVALKTQNELQYHISDITSLALESVFPDPYKLSMDFVERRNKTECDLLFYKNGQKVKPIESSGIGTVDIASFSLRLASWSLLRDKCRNTIILDEPMKFVSEDLRENTTFMLKEISTKLGIQLIVVTHDPILANHADKCFKVIKKRKISKVSDI